MTCVFCSEEIIAGEAHEGFVDGSGAHRNCALRSVIGSVAHLERRCSCYVKGSREGDPPGLTRRQAADQAVELWVAMNKRECD